MPASQLLPVYFSNYYFSQPNETNKQLEQKWNQMEQRLSYFYKLPSYHLKINTLYISYQLLLIPTSKNMSETLGSSANAF